jgi:ATP-dependent Lhr-like helicase
MALGAFSPRVRDWFEAAFAEPTPAQAQAWPAIATGEHTLISAPTGSGKTLAAFLWAIDRLVAEPEAGAGRTRLVYVSPLKALSYDIERNLRAPLRGIGADLRVALRTGDTPQRERQAMLREPPDILITTPESLYLMLTSRAQEMLAGAQWCIIDEIHAVASTKRGAHLALTLERLAANAGRDVQRIGLSATQSPLEEVARFMVGPRRTCRIVDTGVRKELDLRIHVPVESMVEPDAASQPDLDPLLGGTEATRRSIWPAIYPELLELVRAHRSTILFVNARRGAERLALRLNEMAGEEIARAHHGSLAREERVVVEEMLKAGELPCLVATSSLELGIDMGAVDLVIQVESPKSVARGLQRIGRAGHSVGDVSRGRIFPKFRADLLECAVIAKRMREGAIESTVVPRNPLDVLAQQVVAIAAASEEPIAVDDLYALVTATYTFADLPRTQLENVLDMLDGRYPSSSFAELRPRIIWDRVAGTLRARPGARQLAVTNAGTIPDRGLYAVTLPDGRRVGELDEEMVYEARPGQTFLLGATTWRIEEIGRDRVIVTPAPGLPGAVPFWKGDGVGRPRELGGRSARSRAGRSTSPLSALRPSTTSTPARRATSSSSCASSRRPRGWCPPTGPSSSSASATRSATGGCACSHPSAAVSTPPGDWRSAPRSATSSGSKRTRSGQTTGSSSTSPTPTSRRAPSSCSSTPTRSRTAWWPSSPPRRCSVPASARTPPARSSSRGRARASGRRCGSSA